jgi:hypothetical protein
MATETTMPDGTPMYPPCGCPECSPGPGIDYGRDRLEKVLGMLESDRANRIQRQQQLKRRLYGT